MEKQNIKLFQQAETKVNKNIEMGYIPCTLSTNGRFDFDSTIYIRNFDISELMEISTASENEKQLYVVNTIEKIIKGSKNAKCLLETEINEIILSLLANFYAPTLTNMSYILDENEEKDLKKKSLKKYKDYIELKNHGKHMFFVDIPIKNIKIIPINNNVKNHIILKNKNGFQITFKFPRIGDILLVNEYINKRYKIENQKFFELSRLIEEKGTQILTIEQHQSYRHFITNRAKDMLVYTAKLMLVEIGTQKLNTIEEKIKQSIPIQYYKILSTYLQKETFGIQSNVNVISPLSGLPVERRFQFRPTELIQQFENIQPTDEISIDFG